MFKAFQRDLTAMLHAMVGTVHGFNCWGCSPRPEACQLATAQAPVESSVAIQANWNASYAFLYMVLRCA